MSDSREGAIFGPRRLNLRIAPGVTRGNMLTLLFGSFFGIAMMGFINASQPYLFEDVLGVPTQEQGPLAGHLTFLSELVVLVSIGFIGAMSDKFGRKPLWAGAFLIFALAYFVYPLAETVEELTAYRLLFALGLAANTAMLPSVINDYAVEEARGRLISVCFLLNGLGFILLLTPLRLLLPFFEGLTDGDAALAARLWLWTPAAVCLLVSTVLMIGLKPGAPAQLSKREPVLATLKIGIGAARRLRVALAYVAAIIARGDMSVLSTFFVLWLSQQAIASGMSTTDANTHALKFYIMIQVFALCWLPFMGLILDRVDRVVGVVIAMFLAGSGYTALYLLPDPLGPQMWLVAVLIGMGEISANLASLTLIGSVAPEKGRGAVIGMFSFCGAIGILSIAKFGGILSGMYGTIAPFVLVAIGNAVVVTLALLVFARERTASPVRASG